MPRASVIITTHNRPTLLPRAIESARAAARDLEIVVVDDASSDETSGICKSMPAINYIRVDRNQGVAGARNIGLVASSGEYLSFLDDDDLRLAGSIDEQMGILEHTPAAALIYAQAIPEDADGTEHSAWPARCPQGDILWQLLVRNFIPSGSVVFRRSCLAQIGMLDHSIPGIDDWDLWLRAAEVFPIVALESPVVIWRRSSSTSAQGSSDTLRVIELGRQRWRHDWVRLPRVAAAPEKKQAAWRDFSKNIAEHLAWESFSAVRNGRIDRAVQALRTLLQLHPSALYYLLHRWTRASTLATLMAALVHREDLPAARTHFKQVRSNISRR